MPDLHTEASKYAGKIGVDKGKVQLTRWRSTKEGGVPAALGKSLPHVDLAPYRRAKRTTEYKDLKED